MHACVVMMNLGHSFHDHSAEEDAKVGANDMHEANNGRVLSVVYDYVRVFENEKRLNEYEENAGDLAHNGDGECDVAALDHRTVIVECLNHLYETEEAVGHGTHGEYGYTHAHV